MEDAGVCWGTSLGSGRGPSLGSTTIFLGINTGSVGCSNCSHTRLSGTAGICDGRVNIQSSPRCSNTTNAIRNTACRGQPSPLSPNTTGLTVENSFINCPGSTEDDAG